MEENKNTCAEEIKEQEEAEVEVENTEPMQDEAPETETEEKLSGKESR